MGRGSRGQGLWEPGPGGPARPVSTSLSTPGAGWAAYRAAGCAGLGPALPRARPRPRPHLHGDPHGGVGGVGVDEPVTPVAGAVGEALVRVLLPVCVELRGGRAPAASQRAPSVVAVGGRAPQARRATRAASACLSRGPPRKETQQSRCMRAALPPLAPAPRHPHPPLRSAPGSPMRWPPWLRRGPSGASAPGCWRWSRRGRATGRTCGE